jgi:hypothetical protein
MPGKPLRPVPRVQREIMRGMGKTPDDLWSGGRGILGAFARQRFWERVSFVLRVSARKESSVLDLGMRQCVGIGIQPGFESNSAHQGIWEKCDMLAFTVSSIVIYMVWEGCRITGNAGKFEVVEFQP